MSNAEVFISYKAESKSIVNRLDKQLRDFVTIRRYDADVEPFGNLDDFMNTITSADYVIVIISEKFLKSFPCMHEAVLTTDRLDSVFYYVENNVVDKIFTPTGRINQVSYWCKEAEQFRKQYNALPASARAGLESDMQRYDEIQNGVAQFLYRVSTTNNQGLGKIVMEIKNRQKLFRTDSFDSDVRDAILRAIYDNTPMNEIIIFHAQNPVKRAQVEKYIQKSSRTTLRHLKDLVDAGVLEKSGKGSKVSYRRIKDSKPDAYE